MSQQSLRDKFPHDKSNDLQTSQIQKQLERSNSNINSLVEPQLPLLLNPVASFLVRQSSTLKGTSQSQPKKRKTLHNDTMWRVANEEPSAINGRKKKQLVRMQGMTQFPARMLNFRCKNRVSDEVQRNSKGDRHYSVHEKKLGQYLLDESVKILEYVETNELNDDPIQVVTEQSIDKEGYLLPNVQVSQEKIQSRSTPKAKKEAAFMFDILFFKFISLFPQRNPQKKVKSFDPLAKSKLILNSILVGMQHKLADLQTEKHMKIFGLQIRALKINQDCVIKPQRVKPKAKETIEDSQEKKKLIKEILNTQRKTIATSNAQSPEQKKRLPIKPTQTQTTPLTKGAHFRFSMQDQQGMSREQLFLHKLNAYHEFIFCCGLQSGIYVIPSVALEEIKLRVTKGNNSRLVKEILRNRWWVQLVDQGEAVNILWTQLRIPNFHHMQKINKREVVAQKASADVITVNPQKIHKSDRYGYYSDPLHKLVSKQEADRLKQVPQEDRLRYAKMRADIIIVENQQAFKTHNHLEMNWNLGNKKALFQNLQSYFTLLNQEVFQYIPLTFHIQQGLVDKQYANFLQSWKQRQSQVTNDSDRSEDSSNKVQNIWILKPGELTNRGNGIHVCDNLREINNIIQSKSTHANGKPLTHILQIYIERPLLYNKRKFDIRCFLLITRINGLMRAYWYEEGYLRTATAEFNLKDCGNQIHLTNDAIQKQCEDYGKFESGNKLSFLELQRYLDLWYPQDNYNFFRDVYPKLKYIASESVKSVFTKIDVNRRENNFEIFGLDFMIDDKFHPWLIEINTNPCLELSSPLLARIIPQMLENAFRLSIDILYPPPSSSLWHGSKKHQLFYDNYVESNRFQLIFDERSQGYNTQQLFTNTLDDPQFDETDEEFVSENDQ